MNASSALLIRVTGHDRPGVTHALTSILARYDARVLDIGQAVIHDGLAFGILIELSEDLRSSALLTDLLLEAHRLGVEVKFSASSADEYDAWVGAEARRRFIITLLGPAITATHIADVSGVLAGAGLNIDRIDRLSSRLGLRPSDGQPRFCVEFTATSPGGADADEDSVRTRLTALTSSGEVDVAFQHDSIFRRNRRLVAFDMDSTLIQGEVIDELARHAGAGEQVRAITEGAMRGELDFQEAADDRRGRGPQPRAVHRGRRRRQRPADAAAGRPRHRVSRQAAGPLGREPVDFVHGPRRDSVPDWRQGSRSYCLGGLIAC